MNQQNPQFQQQPQGQQSQGQQMQGQRTQGQMAGLQKGQQRSQDKYARSPANGSFLTEEESAYVRELARKYPQQVEQAYQQNIPFSAVGLDVPFLGQEGSQIGPQGQQTQQSQGSMQQGQIGQQGQTGQTGQGQQHPNQQQHWG